MHVLILGASGRTGRLITTEALQRSHTVTALVRDPSTLIPQSGVTLVQGTPLNKSYIEAAFKATIIPPDAVIVALSSLRTSDSPFSKPVSPPRMMADSHRNVVEVMKEFGVRKIVTMQAFGTGSSNEAVFWPMRMVLNHSNMAASFVDHDAVEKVMKEEVTGGTVEWVGVRPVMLSDGERKSVKVWGDDGKKDGGPGMMPSVTRKTVATFIVDAVEGNEWDGMTPVISN